MILRVNQERIVLIIAIALFAFFSFALNGFLAPAHLWSLIQNVSILGVGMATAIGVNFTLAQGGVHALLGENGAGNSTLTKMMCGVTQPTIGQMLIDGAPVAFAKPAEALSRGVAMVFQETRLVASMTVAQNLFLSDEKLFNRIRGLNIAAQSFLQSLNFNVNPTAIVSGLGAAHKQLVEIARAVRKNVRVSSTPSR